MSLEPVYLGKGKLWIGAALVGGTPPALRWLGDVSKLSFIPKAAFDDARESWSGVNAQVAHILTQMDAAVNFVLRHMTADNLALGLWGTNLPVTGSTVTAETLGSGAIVGSLLPLMHPKVSTVVITDSTGTPKTLVENTNYRVNANAGSIEILDLTTGGPWVQPFRAAYAYANYTQIAMMQAAPPAQFLRYEGTNLQDQSPIVAEIYNFAPGPIKNFDPLSQKIQDFEMDGAALIDPSKPATSSLGQFGRILR